MALGDIRRQFPALRHIIHLNSGGMAPLPEPVIAELLRIPQAVAEEGPTRLLLHDEDFVRIEAAHATVAGFLCVEPDEVAFTTQFSTGVSLVLEGLPWAAGDEIVVSDQEHPALLTPVLNIARRFGVAIRRLPVSSDGATMLAGLSDLLSPRTRLLAISHITTEDGTILPVAELTRLAQAAGALVLIDGAHAVGQLPLDLPAIGCDFYAFVGYKWLFGPYPSAGVVIRRGVLDRVEVTWTGSRVTTTAGVDMDTLEFIPGARRFEYGGRPFAYDNAMAAGVDYLAGLGVEAVLAHARGLAATFHAMLATLPGARIHSPADPAKGTGIVTFSVAGVDAPLLATALREHGILTRPALKATAIRASLAAFTNDDDLARLVEAVAAVARR